MNTVLEIIIVLFPVTAVPRPPSPPEVCNIKSTSCTVKFRRPADNIDAPVTGYHVQRSAYVLAGDEVEWETVNDTPITDLELDVDHMTPLSRDQFRVAAEYSFGMSDFSQPSKPVTTNNSVCI